MEELDKAKTLIKTPVKKPPVYYYLLTFVYLSVAIVLGLVGFKIERLGEKNFSAKVLALFITILLIFYIFLSQFFLAVLVVFAFCTFVFLYIDKSTYYLESKFNFYTSERWSDAINAGKTWFRFGILAVIVSLFVATIQIQLFQGGRGGLNEPYTSCAEYSHDGTNTCLLTVPLTRPIGERLSKIMAFYSGQAFLWFGFFSVVVIHRDKLNKSFRYILKKDKD